MPVSGVLSMSCWKVFWVSRFIFELAISIISIVSPDPRVMVAMSKYSEWDKSEELHTLYTRDIARIENNDEPSEARFGGFH
jgi:hypothetical protein